MNSTPPLSPPLGTFTRISKRFESQRKDRGENLSLRARQSRPPASFSNRPDPGKQNRIKFPPTIHDARSRTTLKSQQTASGRMPLMAPTRNTFAEYNDKQ